LGIVRFPPKADVVGGGRADFHPWRQEPCTIVFGTSQRPTEVVGPMLEDEVAELEADFWQARG
jgi:hypothetical protein